MANHEEDAPAFAFPSARALAEGFLSVPGVGGVSSTYVDISGRHEYGRMQLAKVSEPEFKLGEHETIKLTRPTSFQTGGEITIADPREGRVERRSSSVQEFGPDPAPAELGRQEALNELLQLTRTKITLNTTEQKRLNRQSVSSISFGGDMLLYCTAIHSDADEKSMWRSSFPSSYTSVTRIYRPTELAFALASSLCKTFGPHGGLMPLKSTFYGYKSIEYKQVSQMVLHGPVMYVDDPYHHLKRTTFSWERILAMIFLKSRVNVDDTSIVFENQKEYRFALVSVPNDGNDHFLIPFSGTTRDALQPPCRPYECIERAVQDYVERDDREEVSKRASRVSYNYRQKVDETIREEGHAKGNSVQKTRSKIREEEVTGQKMIHGDPWKKVQLPSKQENMAEVIIVHQVGPQVRYLYEVRRDFEMETWVVEARPLDEGENDRQDRVLIPPEWEPDPQVVYDLPYGPPASVNDIVAMVLGASSPRVLIDYRSRDRLTEEEIDQTLSFASTLETALVNVPESDLAIASSASWYASRLVLDVIESFGPIFHRVSVIKAGVVVIELREALLSGASGRFLISGRGTYTVEIINGGSSIVRFPIPTTTPFPITSMQYQDILHANGWYKKQGAT